MLGAKNTKIIKYGHHPIGVIVKIWKKRHKQ